MSGINYSQCWEDTNLLKEALVITDDDIVFSITSGGDNTLSLLLQNPKKIFSIDINPVQNYLTELKLHAPRVLGYEQYLEFLGVQDSNKRAEYFNQVSDLLSKEACSWFRENIGLVEGGVIHAGKFETYLNRFRKYLLPLVHSRQTVSQFIAQSTLEDQVTFYNLVWNTWRWKLFFSIATNSSLLRKYARQTGTAAKQIEDDSYLRRLEQLIYRSHLKSNYYICYALLGEYGELLPDYLLEENYTKLQNNSLGACQFKHVDLLSFLKSAANSSFTKYNLSDAFEFLTAKDADEIWKEIIRTAKEGATVVYWCNQIEHVPGEKVKQNVVQNTTLENKLKKQDRLYFYRSYHIYTITK